MPDETVRPEYYLYEDEIDLRRYVEVMLRRWYWIVGCAVAAALAAFAVSSLMAPTYDASSVVIVTEPRYQMQFEPRFETVDQWRPAYQVFPELAVSDGVLEAVVRAYDPSPAAEIESWRLSAMKGMAEATSQGDPSLVKLTVSNRSPQDAAALANVWAEELAVWVNAIYGDGGHDMAFFEVQAAQAEETLEGVEEALIAFQARDRASIVSAQLQSRRSTQSGYLADQRRIASLIHDIEGLRVQLAQGGDAQPATVADELTSLFLQVKAFNTEAATPIQLQVTNPESLSQRSRGEQALFLADLVETLEARSTTIEALLAELEPEILALQEELQAIQTEGERLKRAQRVAEETYVTLSRKLEEARIAAQEEQGLLQVGSYAAVPESPTGPRRMMNTALAGVVGGMIGLGAVFTWEWWHGGTEEQSPGEDNRFQ